jgi:hypothetical protein
MLMAFLPGSCLFLAGQAFTHAPQPVQSSGATWIVHFRPAKSLPLASALWKVSGAFSSSAGSYTFARIAACGQAMEHLAHWMHTSGSQTGISSATLRFSHWVVAVGQTPSSGMALTGRDSPLPAMIFAVTFRTNSGASAGTTGGLATPPAGSAGGSISWRCSIAWSTAL